MRLPRPNIPLAVRKEVIMHQLYLSDIAPNDGLRLHQLISLLFGDAAVHLDHDPALCNRKFNPRTGRYTPDANDPKYLIYRTRADHGIKTRVRGDGAQLSDLALRRKFKRIEKRKREGKR